MDFTSSIDRLRAIAFVEGVSYLLLLFLAMPLKYIAGFDVAVTWVGWAHGLLFVLYMLAVAHTSYDRKWTFGRILWAMVAAVIPFATFILEKQLRQEKLADPTGIIS